MVVSRLTIDYCKAISVQWRLHPTMFASWNVGRTTAIRPRCWSCSNNIVIIVFLIICHLPWLMQNGRYVIDVSFLTFCISNSCVIVVNTVVVITGVFVKFYGRIGWTWRHLPKRRHSCKLRRTWWRAIILIFTPVPSCAWNKVRKMKKCSCFNMNPYCQ